MSQIPLDAAYLPALDGLRAISILLVVLAHAGLDHVLPGAFGVTLFFFISGYLITRQLLSSLAARGRIGFAGFYLRRALRLMPAGLTYVVVAGLAFMAEGGRISWAGWVSALAYGANIYDLWAGYRSNLPGVRHPFNILWSLAIEEHFYTLWPLLLGLLWKRRLAVGGVVCICVAVLAWRMALFHACYSGAPPGICGIENANPQWRYNRLYLGTDTRLDSIAWGALSALLEAEWPRLAERASSSWLWVGCAASLLAISFLLPGDFARFVLRTTPQGIALMVLLPALLTGDHIWRRALSSRPAMLVGRLSYSLYLWHWGALAIADRLAFHRPALFLAIALLLSTGLAAASYVCIEQPMLRLRRRAGSHAPLSTGVGKPAHAAP